MDQSKTQGSVWLGDAAPPSPAQQGQARRLTPLRLAAFPLMFAGLLCLTVWREAVPPVMFGVLMPMGAICIVVDDAAQRGEPLRSHWFALTAHGGLIAYWFLSAALGWWPTA